MSMKLGFAVLTAICIVIGGAAGAGAAVLKSKGMDPAS